MYQCGGAQNDTTYSKLLCEVRVIYKLTISSRTKMVNTIPAHKT